LPLVSRGIRYSLVPYHRENERERERERKEGRKRRDRNDMIISLDGANRKRSMNLARDRKSSREGADYRYWKLDACNEKRRIRSSAIREFAFSQIDC